MHRVGLAYRGATERWEGLEAGGGVIARGPANRLIARGDGGAAGDSFELCVGQFP
jgi:hypothetical protein